MHPQLPGGCPALGRSRRRARVLVCWEMTKGGPSCYAWVQLCSLCFFSFSPYKKLEATPNPHPPAHPTHHHPRQAVIMSAGGKLSVVLYTVRHVHPGEELTFNYACVTEVGGLPGLVRGVNSRAAHQLCLLNCCTAAVRSPPSSRAPRAVPSPPPVTIRNPTKCVAQPTG